MEKKTDKVVVLMATYNGMEWLPEQVDSILNQSDIELKLLVSDDVSDDGSRSWLESLSKTEQRVQLLAEKPATGTPGQNFYRLICDADIGDANYIAFADQDDIWLSQKLAKQVEQIHRHNVVGVSSNVVAFWPDDSRHFIKKSEPQTQYDFLFESAGPGCGFLITKSLFLEIKELLTSTIDKSKLPELHDWLIYAVCRAKDEKWHISEQPLLKYRQHTSNVVGVNYGLSARLKRLKAIRRGWYRSEVQKVSRIVLELTTNMRIYKVCGYLLRLSLLDRLRLLLTCGQSRRKHFERIVLALAIATFIF